MWPTDRVERRFAVACLVTIALAFAWPSLHATEANLVATPLLQGAVSGQSGVNLTYGNKCRESAIYVTWGTGVSAGAVTIESSYDQGYAGTWAPLIVVTYASGSPKQDIIQITGIHMNLRTRISTNITGGTVSTGIVCN